MARLPRLEDLPRLPGVTELTRAVSAQVELLAALPATLAALNRSVRGLADAVNASRESLLAVQRLAERGEALLDDLEPSLRRWAPQLDRLAALAEDPDLASVARTLRDTQVALSHIAGSTDRLSRLVDDAGGRLSGLPGGALLSRGWRTGTGWGEAIRGGGAEADREPGRTEVIDSDSGSTAAREV
jgi:ABC-type transporter Mla subunit MlaD